MLQDFRLKVFMAVAEYGSFTKAAESLRVSQPAVSQNIAELEKNLNVRLFQRLRGENVLTPEGQVFAMYASRILATQAEAELLFSDLDCPVIRISSAEDVFNQIILPALNDFISVHPDVAIVHTYSEDYDLLVAFESVSLSDRTNLKMVYKPKQAFESTKTCQVLKNILGF